LSLPSIPFGIDVGQGLANAGEALSAVELEELRDQVEEILKNSGRRVVIFIDDIDRLDRAEIQALFKLVRLSAGFSCTTYVLAFDDAIVASSLGERYGRGNVEAGRVFLDKIVQVPLRLPPAEETALRRVALEGVDEALRLSGIAITEREAQ